MACENSTRLMTDYPYRADSLQPANSEVLRLDLKLVGFPMKVSDLMMEADDKLMKSISSIGMGKLRVQRPIFTVGDDIAIQRALNRPGHTFQDYYSRYLKLRKRYVIPVFSHGSFILQEDAPCFIQEVEAFNVELSDLRRQVCQVLESRRHQRALVLKFNPRVCYGVFILTRWQNSNEFFRKMKDRAVERFLKCRRE